MILKNIALDEKDTVKIAGTSYLTIFEIAGKSITIDLNGKTIFVDASKMGEGIRGDMIDWRLDKCGGMLVGVFATNANGHLTLTDSSVDKSGTVEAKAYDAITGEVGIVYALLVNYTSGCSITVNGGNYLLDYAKDCLVYSGCNHGANQGVTVNDGFFYLEHVGEGRNQSAWIFNVLGGNERHVQVNGGTFNADIQHQYWVFEVEVPKQYALQNNGDGTYTIVEAKYYVNEYYYAGKWWCNETGYATEEEAKNAVELNKRNAEKANAAQNLPLGQVIPLGEEA